MPTDEQVRQAVETAVREGLANEGGDWYGETTNGDEVEFRPQEKGRIFVNLCDDEDNERTVRLRVSVTLE